MNGSKILLPPHLIVCVCVCVCYRAPLWRLYRLACPAGRCLGHRAAGHCPPQTTAFHTPGTSYPKSRATFFPTDTYFPLTRMLPPDTYAPPPPATSSLSKGDSWEEHTQHDRQPVVGAVHSQVGALEVAVQHGGIQLMPAFRKKKGSHSEALEMRCATRMSAKCAANPALVHRCLPAVHLAAPLCIQRSPLTGAACRAPRPSAASSRGRNGEWGAHGLLVKQLESQTQRNSLRWQCSAERQRGRAEQGKRASGPVGGSKDTGGGPMARPRTMLMRHGHVSFCATPSRPSRALDSRSLSEPAQSSITIIGGPKHTPMKLRSRGRAC